MENFLFILSQISIEFLVLRINEQNDDMKTPDFNWQR